MRQKLYRSQDDIDTKKENLLEKVETQLNQKPPLCHYLLYGGK